MLAGCDFVVSFDANRVNSDVTRFQRTLLVVGPSWVGDMVMAQALFKVLKRQDRDLAIDVVAPPGALPLTGRMPEVRKSIALPVGHGALGLRTRWRVARDLGRRSYDRAIVLPLSYKSALLPLFAGIPLRTGYRGEWRFGLINDMRRAETFEAEQNVRGYLGLAAQGTNGLGGTVPRPALTVDRENQRRLVTDLSLRLDRPVVALAPGAAQGPAKRWPARRFGELAAMLSDAGCAVWVMGGPDDWELGEVVLDRVDGGGVNLAGRTTLPDAVDLLNLTSVAVSNDSGLMHVAAAAGSRVVALYGPTSPAFAPPLTDEAVVVYTGIECSPCFKPTCPLGHHKCMGDISADDVMSKTLLYVGGT